MDATSRQSWFRAVVFIGILYALVGITFALPASHARAWRLAAWVVSGMVYAVHIGFERFRLRNSCLLTALHVASATALGALGLAVGAIIHSFSIHSTGQHQRLLLVALVAWPVITGVPAFLVGLGVSGLLAKLSRRTLILLMALAWSAYSQDTPPYTTYTNFAQVLEARNARYAAVIRISDPGTPEHRIYTGFFFYQVLQFDTTGRYVLGLRVYCQGSDVKPSDRGDVGYIDLKDDNKWTKIGETTAWNWQQGNRLQWRPHSDEILWNDRSDDGKKFACRTFNFRTGARRTLPRPIYDVSPDGATALTHDFERMNLFHEAEYVGIEDPYEKQFAPAQTGVWKMNMDTGKAELILSLEKMAAIAYPNGIPSSGHLYFFREGWNPSGTRLIAFIKDPLNHNMNDAYTMAPDGTGVRFFYHGPSHHSWQDDYYLLDFGHHEPPDGGAARNGYFLFRDDGTGKAKELLWPVSVPDGFGGDGHDSFLPGPGGDWIISDTYVIAGYQFLFLYHRATKIFIPLARLKSTAENMPNFMDEFRVDLHPRFSRDGRTVCIDSTYEGLGRQMYIIDIGFILDHPPTRR